MKTVAVVGLGLMGGSLCRALKADPRPLAVLGVDSDPDQGRRALEAGALDEFSPSAGDLLGRADVVVYATPLGRAISLLREHSGLWKKGVLVTDLVSLKAPLMRVAATGGFSDRFVGAHPICGGEGSGFESSREGLFRGARIWLCAAEDVPAETRDRARSFWAGVGGDPEWIEPRAHDERMAWVSHLPQLVSNALAGALDSAGLHPSQLGPGGRDMTRLAGSNPELWRDLLEASAPVTGVGLTSVAQALKVLADLLARRDVDRIAEFMERTRKWREGGP
ncbi:MAG: prephenate dehydrogenase [Gemmatimonadetes bacterium]|nr:prephenate dehydrogenase [Gemmatimonadota bacterium]